MYCINNDVNDVYKCQEQSNPLKIIRELRRVKKSNKEKLQNRNNHKETSFQYKILEYCNVPDISDATFQLET